MLVLLYHRVHPRFGVHPELFKEQMFFLRRHLKVVSLKEAENPPPFSALVTFDDGFYDVFHYAYPVLKELSIPAVIFVSPERLLNSQVVRRTPEPSNRSTCEAFRNSFLKGDNSAFLSWGELKEMGDVFSVQSHGLSHRAAVGQGGKPYGGEDDWRVFSLSEEERENLSKGAPLTSILVADPERARKELRSSKELIENRLGTEVNSIAFPWGIYSRELLETAREEGYRFCFTTERGWNRRLSCKVKRLAVGERKGMGWFRTRSFLYSL